MSISDRINEQVVALPFNATLCAAIQDVQRTERVLAYWHANKPDSAFIPGLHIRQTQNTSQLWSLLRPHLMDVARDWAYRSAIARNMPPGRHPSYKTQFDVQEGLAMIAFGYILEALTRLKIDPTRNVLGLLITIAWRSLKLEQGIYCRRSIEWEPTSEINDKRITEDVADHDSDEMYERVIMQMADSEYLAAIGSFWKRTLKAVDQKIIDCYLDGEMTPTSAEIAQKMGPGWTAGQVRQRLRRIIVATREYLQGIEGAEFADLGEDRLDDVSIAMLRTPAAREFCGQQLKPKDQRIIKHCIESERIPTYQQVAEQMGESGGASRVRERVKRAVARTRNHLQTSGEIEA